MDCTRRCAIGALVLLATPPALADGRRGSPPNGPPHGCTEKGVDVGAAKAFAVGTFKLIEADFGRLIVARDAKGLYAFSAMCTHMGGAVSLVDDKGTTVCPSHQSMFGANGEVIRGPATRPLPHFAVKVCEGRVLVDPLTVVGADDRAAVS
jgi:Rieske Fe-S protein